MWQYFGETLYGRSLGWCLIVLVVFLGYYPGLAGTFLLDDYGTLAELTRWNDGGITRFIDYLHSGHSGPTGRPVALLTFYVQEGSWPHEPSSFLFVNLVIHVVNTFLLALFIYLLLRPSRPNTAYVFSFALALLWGAHPYHVSTVLYVVQRMTLLATAFSLCAMLFYVQWCLTSQTKVSGARFSWNLFGVGVCGCLAVLSKETALVLPWLLGLIGWFLIQNGTKAYYAGRYLFVIIPSFLVFLLLVYFSWPYLLSLLFSGEEVIIGREFSWVERLLTENRVVGDYLIGILRPASSSAGVFNDGYPISKAINEPISTLFWFLFHSSLVIISIIVRRRVPLVTFGILWFYLGHVIESTVLMLELKFEHRNYLPSIGLIVAIIGVMPTTRLIQPIGQLLVILFGLLLVSITLIRSDLWGHPEEAITVWSHHNPNSIRVHEFAENYYASSNNPELLRLAKLHLLKAINKSDDPFLTVKFYAQYCGLNGEVILDVPRLVDKLTDSKINWQMISVLESLLNKIRVSACSMTYKEFSQILAAVNSNPNYKGTSYPLLFSELKGNMLMYMGDSAAAINTFRSLPIESIPLEMVIRQAALLATYGELNEALIYIEKGVAVHNKSGSFVLEQAIDVRNKIAEEMSEGSK